MRSTQVVEQPVQDDPKETAIWHALTAEQAANESYKKWKTSFKSIAGRSPNKDDHRREPGIGLLMEVQRCRLALMELSSGVSAAFELADLVPKDVEFYNDSKVESNSSPDEKSVVVGIDDNISKEAEKEQSDVGTINSDKVESSVILPVVMDGDGTDDGSGGATVEKVETSEILELGVAAVAEIEKLEIQKSLENEGKGNKETLESINANKAKLKQYLHEWELRFKETHGHIPSLHDKQTGDAAMIYKTYSQVRKLSISSKKTPIILASTPVQNSTDENTEIALDALSQTKTSSFSQSQGQGQGQVQEPRPGNIGSENLSPPPNHISMAPVSRQPSFDEASLSSMINSSKMTREVRGRGVVDGNGNSDEILSKRIHSAISRKNAAKIAVKAWVALFTARNGRDPGPEDKEQHAEASSLYLEYANARSDLSELSRSEVDNAP